MSEIFLFPMPRQVQNLGGIVHLPQKAKILIPAPAMLFSAQWIQSALQDIGLDWEIVGYAAQDDFAIRLQETDIAEQAYRLTLDANGIVIEGKAAGLFYGLCTLRQLILHDGRELPSLAIDDAPDFVARGVMLDISRDKVPTMETLYQLVDEFAALKINQLQLYMEHTFAYQAHEEVWRFASPLTAEEVLELDAYCQQRFIELVPNQNSLGHMERWLKHPRYLPLAEKEDGFVPSWGGPWRSPSTVNPLDPRSFELYQELYDEFLPNFSSKQFNVGCDEPWELGQGKSKEENDKEAGRVYLNWLQKLHKEVTGRGYRMMFWGDIIIHHPELVTELPEDIIVMEWGYEADHDFANHSKLFAQSKIPFYVCPGTSSWNTIIGRTDNALENLRSSAEHGLKNGAIGYLNTDWGDNGHMQPLPVSYLGFAYGAAVSWGYEANKDADIAEALSRFVFRDAAGVMGNLAYELGNVYQDLQMPVHNGQIAAYAIQVKHYREGLRAENGLKAKLPAERIQAMIARIDALLAPVEKQAMQREDAALLVDEFKQAAALIQHGLKWLLWSREEGDLSAYQLRMELDGLIAKQRENWLARNRRGGLEDSMRRLEVLREEYS